MHPRRFKTKRWEEQMSEQFTEGFSESVDHNTGWMLRAPDEKGWGADSVAAAVSGLRPHKAALGTLAAATGPAV